MGIFIFYLILCFLVASTGANKPIGYWGVFLWSLLLSPLIGLIIGLVSKDFPPAPPKLVENKCKHCDYTSTKDDYYCPRCLRDSEGYTVEENKIRFQKTN